ncbi:MAG: alpha/beta hydrolase [bacterium]
MAGIRKKAGLLLGMILGMIFLFGVSSALAAFPPVQPAQGPGGADYIHGRVIKTVQGSGDQAYYLFEPDEPRPDTAPLIVFLHGWGGTNPDYYHTWIEHLVKKGNIVVFPVYQSWGSLLSSNRYNSNCLEAITAAIRMLQSGDHVRPDLDRLAIVGHSVGGILALNIAVLAQQSGLPVPKAIMSVEPKRAPMLSLEDVSAISSRTLLLVVTGDQDGLSSDDAARIFRNTSQIPLKNKDFVTLVSDDYGDPPLIADHLAPVSNAAGGRILLGIVGTACTDALDYYGTWKLFDALTDAAFFGKNREYALGNTVQQRYMGRWSDGRPVKELIITDHPQPRSRNGLRQLIPRLRSRERQSAETGHRGGS